MTTAAACSAVAPRKRFCHSIRARHRPNRTPSRTSSTVNSYTIENREKNLTNILPSSERLAWSLSPRSAASGADDGLCSSGLGPPEHVVAYAETGRNGFEETASHCFPCEPPLRTVREVSEYGDALKRYRRNRNGSVAHFRIAETFFEQGNHQATATSPASASAPPANTNTQSVPRTTLITRQ